jgi:hypothetical protein
MNKVAMAAAAVIPLILLTSGCLYSRTNDEQEVTIRITGVQKYNEGYILIPALIYGFKNDDLKTAEISGKLTEKDGWSVEEIEGMDHINITLRYDIDVTKKIEDPEPAYFRSREFDTGSELHSIEVYLHMETDQDLTVELKTMHSDDFHWFSSECTGFVSEGWNSLTVFYTLEEA